MNGLQTKGGFYETSKTDQLADIFEKYVSGKKFLDLGSGLGWVVKFAKKYASLAKGIELEKEFIICTHEPDSIIEGDLFDHDLSQYEVLYYFIAGTLNEAAMLEKIKAEFKGTLIIYHRTHDERTKNQTYDNIDLTLLESWKNGKVYEI